MRDGGVTSGGVEQQIRCSRCADRHRDRMPRVALDTRRARRHLMAADPVMADLIRRAGPCRLGASPRRRPVLPAAAGHRLAAALDQGRGDHLRPAVRALPRRRADPVAPARARRRRRCAASASAPTRPGSCATWRRGSATAASTCAALDTSDDAAALTALTAVLGIGTWTAEIFLLFQLHRPDIMPVGDLGLLTAMQRALPDAQPADADSER